MSGVRVDHVSELLSSRRPSPLTVVARPTGRPTTAQFQTKQQLYSGASVSASAAEVAGRGSHTSHTDTTTSQSSLSHALPQAYARTHLLHTAFRHTTSMGHWEISHLGVPEQA